MSKQSQEAKVCASQFHTIPLSERIERIVVCDSTDQVAQQAAEKLVSLLKSAVNSYGKALLVMACDPSQQDTWGHLSRILNSEQDLLKKITFVNMREYRGLNKNHHGSHSYLLDRKFFRKLEPRPSDDKIVLFRGDAPDFAAECMRITDELRKFHRRSIVIMGSFGADGKLINELLVSNGNKPRSMVCGNGLSHEDREKLVLKGGFKKITAAPTGAFGCTRRFVCEIACGGIVLTATGSDRAQAATAILAINPPTESQLALLYQRHPKQDMTPPVPFVYLDQFAGSLVKSHNNGEIWHGSLNLPTTTGTRNS